MSKRKVSAALLCTAATVLAQYAIQAHQQPQIQQNRTGQAGLRLIVDYEGCRRNASDRKQGIGPYSGRQER